jgi:hypothetical protein
MTMKQWIACALRRLFVFAAFSFSLNAAQGSQILNPAQLAEAFEKSGLSVNEFLRSQNLGVVISSGLVRTEPQAQTLKNLFEGIKDALTRAADNAALAKWNNAAGELLPIVQKVMRNATWVKAAPGQLAVARGAGEANVQSAMEAAAAEKAEKQKLLVEQQKKEQEKDEAMRVITSDLKKVSQDNVSIKDLTAQLENLQKQLDKKHAELDKIKISGLRSYDDLKARQEVVKQAKELQGIIDSVASQLQDKLKETQQEVHNVEKKTSGFISASGVAKGAVGVALVAAAAYGLKNVAQSSYGDSIKGWIASAREAMPTVSFESLSSTPVIVGGAATALGVSGYLWSQAQWPSQISPAEQKKIVQTADAQLTESDKKLAQNLDLDVKRYAVIQARILELPAEILAVEAQGIPFDSDQVKEKITEWIGLEKGLFVLSNRMVAESETWMEKVKKIAPMVVGAAVVAGVGYLIASYLYSKNSGSAPTVPAPTVPTPTVKVPPVVIPSVKEDTISVTDQIRNIIGSARSAIARNFNKLAGFLRKRIADLIVRIVGKENIVVSALEDVRDDIIQLGKAIAGSEYVQAAGMTAAQSVSKAAMQGLNLESAGIEPW